MIYWRKIFVLAEVCFFQNSSDFFLNSLSMISSYYIIPFLLVLVHKITFTSASTLFIHEWNTKKIETKSRKYPLFIIIFDSLCFFILWSGLLAIGWEFEAECIVANKYKVTIYFEGNSIQKCSLNIFETMHDRTSTVRCNVISIILPWYLDWNSKILLQIWYYILLSVISRIAEINTWICVNRSMEWNFLIFIVLKMVFLWDISKIRILINF